MPGSREDFLDNEDRKTVSLEFCGLVLKYCLWRQIRRFKLY
jgi:hypothetical protein